MENKHTLQDAFSAIAIQMKEISKQENLSEIERDLLLENIRNFYVVVKHSPCNTILREHRFEERVTTLVAENEEIPVEHVSLQEDIAQSGDGSCVDTLNITVDAEPLKEEPKEKTDIVMQMETPAEDLSDTEPVLKEETDTFKMVAPSSVAEEKQEVVRDVKFSAETLFDFAPPAPSFQEVKHAEERIPEVLNYLNQNLHRKKTPLQTPAQDTVSVSETVQDKARRKTIAENFAPTKSLIDSFSDQKDRAETNIATRIGQSHKDLRNTIGVNEKFMFINDLFAGNMRSYTDFISQLNKEENGTDALLLVKQMADTRHWVETSLAYSTLVSIINKKFAK